MTTLQWLGVVGFALLVCFGFYAVAQGPKAPPSDDDPQEGEAASRMPRPGYPASGNANSSDRTAGDKGSQ